MRLLVTFEVALCVLEYALAQPFDGENGGHAAAQHKQTRQFGGGGFGGGRGGGGFGGNGFGGNGFGGSFPAGNQAAPTTANPPSTTIKTTPNPPPPTTAPQSPKPPDTSQNPSPQNPPSDSGGQSGSSSDLSNQQPVAGQTSPLTGPTSSGFVLGSNSLKQASGTIAADSIGVSTDGAKPTIVTGGQTTAGLASSSGATIPVPSQASSSLNTGSNHLRTTLIGVIVGLVVLCLILLAGFFLRKMHIGHRDRFRARGYHTDPIDTPVSADSFGNEKNGFYEHGIMEMDNNTLWSPSTRPTSHAATSTVIHGTNGPISPMSHIPTALLMQELTERINSPEDGQSEVLPNYEPRLRGTRV